MSRLQALARLRVNPPVNQFRYHAYRDVPAFPRRHQGNLCGWRGRRFLAFGHRSVLEHFAPAFVRRQVLVPPVPNPPPFDFNWRRMYFARA
jgi:hypothetical protein